MEYDVDNYRLRFVENGRYACCADVEGLEISEEHDDSYLSSGYMDKIWEYACRIQDQHLKAGLPVPELDIVVFIKHRTEEHLSFRYKP